MNKSKEIWKKKKEIYKTRLNSKLTENKIEYKLLSAIVKRESRKRQ
jgi:hypothetical protein